MGKGDWRRPSNIPKDEYDQKFEAVFGPKKLNVMSDEERLAFEKERESVGQEQPGSTNPASSGTG